MRCSRCRPNGAQYHDGYYCAKVAGGLVGYGGNPDELSTFEMYLIGVLPPATSGEDGWQAAAYLRDPRLDRTPLERPRRGDLGDAGQAMARALVGGVRP